MARQKEEKLTFAKDNTLKFRVKKINEPLKITNVQSRIFEFTIEDLESAGPILPKYMYFIGNLYDISIKNTDYDKLIKSVSCDFDLSALKSEHGLKPSMVELTPSEEKTKTPTTSRANKQAKLPAVNHPSMNTLFKPHTQRVLKESSLSKDQVIDPKEPRNKQIDRFFCTQKISLPKCSDILHSRKRFLSGQK